MVYVALPFVISDGQVWGRKPRKTRRDVHNDEGNGQLTGWKYILCKIRHDLYFLILFLEIGVVSRGMGRAFGCFLAAYYKRSTAKGSENMRHFGGLCLSYFEHYNRYYSI